MILCGTTTVTLLLSWLCVLLRTQYENNNISKDLAERYLDANAETTSYCKSVSEIVDHVSQQVQPATSLQTSHHAFYAYGH